jgi:hypothetical protein
MKTYKVTYKETLIHTFYVEAEDEDEADAIFEGQCMACELDFSDGVVDEAEYTIDVVNDDYTPSAENGDYSPSNPWDSPGYRISDFIGGVYD